MDTLTKKEILINNINGIDDENIIDTINNIVDFEIARNFSFNKLSKEDLIERALISLEDIKQGNVIELDDLILESERW